MSLIDNLDIKTSPGDIFATRQKTSHPGGKTRIDINPSTPPLEERNTKLSPMSCDYVTSDKPEAYRTTYRYLRKNKKQ